MLNGLLNAAGSRVATILLVVGLVFALLTAAPNLAMVHLPGNQQGYEPAQPIAFSHRLHAGELQVQCLYCHSGAERSRHAGIPAASTCMNCHRFVTATRGAVRAEDELAQQEKRSPRRIVSPELKKLYDALALDEKLQRDYTRPLQPIRWTKVYNLPDFVYFDHRPHVNAGVTCQSCHGSVETMERVRQSGDLSMGWCVNCHRGVNGAGLDGKGNFTTAPAPAFTGAKPVTRRVYASTDCSTCHY
ncbi:MAG TPA: cytochrome c3 family protein [Terriglobales bacterium]|nr:cytochrome c3 family protein [Terriglobales bacterium]